MKDDRFLIILIAKARAIVDVVMGKPGWRSIWSGHREIDDDISGEPNFCSG